MSKIVLYGMKMSPPVRASLLTLRALNLDYEYKEVNLLAAEHHSDEYLKLNPQHTVPLLDDNGFLIWDSHAIAAYLVDKYGKDDSLYPKDLAKRAAVNQRLYFEASVLFMAVRNITRPFGAKGVTHVPMEKIDDIADGYDHLETFLGDNPYVSGDTLTIADFSCVAIVTSAQYLLDIDPEKYPKIIAWIKRLEKLPHYKEDNQEGADIFHSLIKDRLTIVES